MLNIPFDIKNKNNIEIFLQENKISNHILESIPQDASNRNYYRMSNSLLLMESKAPENKNYEFIKVANYLRQIGLSAPEIIKTDHKKGLYLIEIYFHKATHNQLYGLTLDYFIYFIYLLQSRLDFVTYLKCMSRKDACGNTILDSP